MNNECDRRLARALLVIRLVLGLFLLQWTIEKFIDTEGMTSIFDYFYGIEIGLSSAQIVGGVELVLVTAFLAGAYKNIVYPLFLLFNAVSVGSTWKQLIDPYASSNHLFTAGIPLVATTWLLWYLRDRDILFCWDEKRRRERASDGGE